MKKVLIIGGYGNFGQFIATKLAQEPNITLIIAGRDEAKAKALCKQLKAIHPPQVERIDIDDGLENALSQLNPDIVIHTSGPFQDQSYHVALACIQQGCHYIDLADARTFVSGITSLNEKAVEKGVLICSGASSVPCLTAAIVDHYKSEFESLESLQYGIATAHLTNGGMATTLAVLSYAGKPFKTITDGKVQEIYGWLGLSCRKYWGLNTRLMGNGDIPDLDIFPERYPGLKTIRFQAGLGLKFLHLMLWVLSCLVRIKILSSLQPLAPLMLKGSHLFDLFGGKDSGFYMTMKGMDKNGASKQINFDLIAHQGHGLNIPAIPAILMAKKLAGGDIHSSGAYPCVGFITLDEYLNALGEFDIKWQTT